MPAVVEIYIFWKWVLCGFFADSEKVLSYHKRHTIHTEHDQTFAFLIYVWQNAKPCLIEILRIVVPTYLKCQHLQNQTESERNFDPKPKTHFKGKDATWIINGIGNIFLAFKQRFSCGSTRSLRFKEILCLLI